MKSGGGEKVTLFSFFCWGSVVGAAKLLVGVQLPVLLAVGPN